MRLPWPLSREMLATTLAVVGVLAVLDFALRVYVGRGAGERPYDPPTVVAVPSAYEIGRAHV